MLRIVIMMLITASCTCNAILYPVMTEVHITSCSNNEEGYCNKNVAYSGKMEMLEIGLIDSPRTNEGGGRYVEAYGIHCDKGDASKQIPYSGCSWTNIGHSPDMRGCWFDPNKGNTWELKGTCSIDQNWGLHSGASPGGECVMFGEYNLAGYGRLFETPFGILDATTVANGGSQYCIKATAPDVTCKVSLPPVLDHGVILTGMSDTRSIYGSVDCGDTVVVTVVGPTEIKFAPGVQTTVTPVLMSKNQLQPRPN